jgi:hypothetical protein
VSTPYPRGDAHQPVKVRIEGGGVAVFNSIGRSYQLAKASFGVLRSDKKLLIFPLVSFVALVIVTIGFAVPFVLMGGIPHTDQQVNPAAYVLAFVFYAVTYTVTFFFNTALVGAALIRLERGDPTLRDGFRIAFSRLPQIIGYALIAATVGMILRVIAERAAFVGQIVAGIIGLAWSVTTFLVVPVLAVEGVGPIEAIKRSGGLLRKTWGEQIVGNVGIGVVFGLLFIVVAFVGVLLIVALAKVSGAAVMAGILVLMLLLGGIALIGSAVSGIFVASVYRYATKGDGGAKFSPEVLSGAFRQRT